MLVGVPLWHPGQVPTLPAVLPRSLLWLATAVSPLDIAHAIAQDADVQADAGRGRSPRIVRPLCPGALLVSLPHRPFSRCLLGIWTWQMRLFACRRLTHRSPFRSRLRWPLVWCWTTASTIFCVASALHCEWPSWMTSGLRPAVPQLSALASRFTLHQFAVQHLLCPLFVFRLFSPVTDSDKLIKAHETKKRTAVEAQ